MAVIKIREYLQEREGREVSYEELAAAGLAPTETTLRTDLARLVANPREGISRVGAERVKGVHRGYRYDKPPAPEPAQFMTLRLIARSAAGNWIGQEDDGMRIYEIVPVGRMLVRLAEQPA